MKKSIVSLLLLFMLSVGFANIVFGQSSGVPLSGIPVGLEHDPAGIAINHLITDDRGNFSFSKLPEGKYKLTIPYDQVIKAAGGTGRIAASRAGSVEIDLILEGQAVDASKFAAARNLKAPSKIIVTKETSVISLTIPKGGGMLNGTLSISRKALPVAMPVQKVKGR